MDGKLSDIMPEKDERVGSMRAELRTALEKHDPELAKAFNEMTPEQKKAGRLVSALIEGASRGNEGIESAFTWWEEEYNNSEKVNNRDRGLFLFMDVENGCDLMSDETYRGVRKIAVTMLMN